MLLTQVRPAEIGRRVNPFIGTGGFPWVCGHNFPGAMVPFGMVRLGPETASILLHKRALNTSGYYYGDDQILGFSHTRLNGTGATDGGQFLVMPTRDLWSRTCSASGNPRPSRTARSWPRPVTTRSGCRSPACSPNSRPPRASVSTAIRLATEKLPHLMLDVMNALGGRRASEGNVRVLPGGGEVEGSVRTFGTFSGALWRHQGVFRRQIQPAVRRLRFLAG